MACRIVLVMRGADGRFWECSDIDHNYGNRPNLSTLNAEYWFGHNDDYERGNQPALGAVLCLADGPFSGDGHVAIVEEIDENTGIITCSNSAYGGQFWYLSHLSPPHYLPQAGYRFQGFIYNPIVGGSPWWKKKPWLWKRELYNREEFLIR